MKHDIYVWLEDINRSISEIYEYLPDSISYKEFENDLRSRRAVERNIEIIGEAFNGTVEEVVRLKVLFKR